MTNSDRESKINYLSVLISTAFADHQWKRLQDDDYDHSLLDNILSPNVLPQIRRYLQEDGIIQFKETCSLKADDNGEAIFGQYEDKPSLSLLRDKPGVMIKAIKREVDEEMPGTRFLPQEYHISIDINELDDKQTTELATALATLAQISIDESHGMLKRRSSAINEALQELGGKKPSTRFVKWVEDHGYTHGK